MSRTGPDSAVTAWCAPGLAGYAARLLESAGETVREITEHPWMAGRTDVILTASVVSFPLPERVQAEGEAPPAIRYAVLEAARLGIDAGAIWPWPPAAPPT